MAKRQVTPNTLIVSKLSSPFFKEIGRVVVYSAWLEFDMHNAVRHFLGMQVREGQLVTTNVRSFRNLKELMEKAAALALTQKSISQADFERLRQFVCEIDKADRERNDCVHPQWLWMPYTKRGMRRVTRKGTTEATYPDPLSGEQIKAIADGIRNLRTRFYDFLHDDLKISYWI